MDHTKYNKADAKKKVDEFKKEAPDWFCPLIKSSCRIDCLCFQPPKMTRMSLTKDRPLYYVYDHMCTNGMFTTDRQCYTN